MGVLAQLPCTCATGPGGSLLCRRHVIVTIDCWLDDICYRR